MFSLFQNWWEVQTPVCAHVANGWGAHAERVILDARENIPQIRRYHCPALCLSCLYVPSENAHHIIQRPLLPLKIQKKKKKKKMGMFCLQKDVGAVCAIYNILSSCSSSSKELLGQSFYVLAFLSCFCGYFDSFPSLNTALWQ